MRALKTETTQVKVQTSSLKATLRYTSVKDRLQHPARNHSDTNTLQQPLTIAVWQCSSKWWTSSFFLFFFYMSKSFFIVCCMREQRVKAILLTGSKYQNLEADIYFKWQSKYFIYYKKKPKDRFYSVLTKAQVQVKATKAVSWVHVISCFVVFWNTLFLLY